MYEQKMIEDMERIRYITTNWVILQGLKKMPFGVAMLVSAAVRVGWLPVPGWAENYIDVNTALTILAGVLLSITTVYYRRTFGHVLQTRANLSRIGGLFIAACLILIGGIFVDQYLKPPFITTCLIMAATLFGYFWQYRKFAFYYIAMAAAVLVVGLLPLAGVIRPEDYLPAGQLALGSILFFGGIFDHLLILRALGGAERNGHETV